MGAMLDPRQTPSPARLAASLTRTVLRRALLNHLGAWSTDMLARLSVLEGAAGVAPGTWLVKRERGFGDALNHFGPNLAPAWTSATDQGVYDKAVSAARRSLQDVSSMDADDLVQEMMLGSNSAASPRRSRLFYSVGEQLRKFEHDLGTGVIAPSNSKIKGTIEHWVRGQARDVLRSSQERKTEALPRVETYGVHSRGPGGLSHDQRDNLLLLALQSPGGPGNEIRHAIDSLVDRAFPPAQRPIVRMFLEELGKPQYRSADEVKKMVFKFDPDKWFTYAFNHIRTDIMNSMKVSPQQVTNALGGKASRVFEFMQNYVGKDSRVQSILGQLADEIELLEPGIGEKVAKENRAELPPEQTPVSPHSVLRQWFEKDQFGEWGDQSTPLAQFSAGPIPLRVARQWVAAKAAL